MSGAFQVRRVLLVSSAANDPSEKLKEIPIFFRSGIDAAEIALPRFPQGAISRWSTRCWRSTMSRPGSRKDGRL